MLLHTFMRPVTTPQVGVMVCLEPEVEYYTAKHCYTVTDTLLPAAASLSGVVYKHCMQGKLHELVLIRPSSMSLCYLKQRESG